MFGDALTVHLSRLEENKRLWQAEAPAQGRSTARDGGPRGGPHPTSRSVPAQPTVPVEQDSDGITAATDMYAHRPRFAREPPRAGVNVRITSRGGSASGSTMSSSTDGGAVNTSLHYGGVRMANNGRGQVKRATSVTRSPFGLSV